MTDDCVFCRVVAGKERPLKVTRFSHTMTFEPLNPVTPGHMLVIPYAHVRDACEEPPMAALVMETAAALAREVGPCNIITSVGREATQTVFHFHIHIVPRRPNDGIKLPWSEP